MPLNKLCTYLRSWTLLEKLPIEQPLKNFPEFCRTPRFITVFTRALDWSLSWARSIQSIPSHPVYLRSILILSTHLRLRLPSGLFPPRFLTNILYAFLFSPIRATCPAHLILLDLLNLIMFGEENKLWTWHNVSLLLLLLLLLSVVVVVVVVVVVLHLWARSI
jgi:hypothetical protein